VVVAERIASTRNGSRFKRGAMSGRRTADVFARAAAQLYDFVLRVTDIPAQETIFMNWNVSEELHEHNFSFISRAGLEWIEALFCRVAKTRSYPS
jgi:hypothetical protein